MNLIQKCDIANTLDADNNPTGGHVRGIGLDISWQDGPLGRGEDRKGPNGAFVETVLSACKQRLEFYNEGKFRCRENSLAITKIEEALHWLEHRTRERENREVEGTHKE